MPVHCTPQSQADVPRVKHVIQIVDLDSSFDISDELLAIQCIKSAVSNDNLEFSRNNIEGMSYLLALTKVWLAFNLHLINNAQMIIMPPEKRWLYFSKQAYTKGISHNKATQLSLVPCTETDISSRHLKKT